MYYPPAPVLIELGSNSGKTPLAASLWQGLQLAGKVLSSLLWKVWEKLTFWARTKLKDFFTHWQVNTVTPPKLLAGIFPLKIQRKTIGMCHSYLLVTEKILPVSACHPTLSLLASSGFSFAVFDLETILEPKLCVRNNFRVIRALEMFHIKRISHNGEGQGVTSFFSLLKIEILMTISNQVKRRKIEEEKLIAHNLAFTMSCTDKMRFCVYRQWIKCMWFWTPTDENVKSVADLLSLPLLANQKKILWFFFFFIYLFSQFCYRTFCANKLQNLRYQAFQLNSHQSPR